MSIMDFSGKKFLVIGAGISGRAASLALADHGGTVVLNDMKAIDVSEKPWPDLASHGVKLVFGSQETSLLDGMDVVVPSPVISPEIPIMKAAAAKGLPIWSEVEVACRVTDADIIGITGTNGKTTTTHIIAHILRSAGHHVGVIGTIHALIDDEELPIHNTTPDVVELQRFLALMYEKGMTHVVMEVSSHALALDRVAGIEYDTAVFTNLTQDHLDFHKTMENYVAAKAKLFQSLTAADHVKDNKTAIVNVDDPWSKQILDACHCQVLTYGVEQDADLKGSNLNVELKRSSFDVVGPFVNVHLNMNITGLFNVYNTLAAIGAAHAEGIDEATIDKAIQTFHSVAGRFELVEAGQPFAIVVDYSHTPDSLEKALETARAMNPNHVIAVFGCGGDRDRTKRPIMGRIGAELADIPIVTSDNPRSENPDAIVAEVEEGVKQGLKAGQHHEVIVNRREAIYRAVELAQENDIIVIAGKGHETYQILNDGTIHFDDREEARNAVRDLHRGDK